MLASRAGNAKGEYLFPRRVGSGYDWTQAMNELHPAHYQALAACGLRFPPTIFLRHSQQKIEQHRRAAEIAEVEAVNGETTVQ